MDNSAETRVSSSSETLRIRLSRPSLTGRVFFIACRSINSPADILKSCERHWISFGPATFEPQPSAASAGRLSRTERLRAQVTGCAGAHCSRACPRSAFESLPFMVHAQPKTKRPMSAGPDKAR